MNRDFLLAQMKHSELQALWWIASATTGHAETRVAFHGSSTGPRFTPDELRAAAMVTAQVHIRNFHNLSESLLKLKAEN